MTKGISLHIGLNSYDSRHYGDSGKLAGCENDARAMHRLAKLAGFEAKDPLYTKSATSQNVTSAITETAKQLEEGDIFMLTYSGHGGQVWDYAFDEAVDEPASYQGVDENKNDVWLEEGGKDETLCLYDRMFKDDELYHLIKRFKPGVRIIYITDCCHAASNYKDVDGETDKTVAVRGIGVDKASEIYEKNKSEYDEAWFQMMDPHGSERVINCSIVQLAACRDSELSYDGSNGVFTKHLLRTWNEGEFKGNYRSLLNQISTKVKAEQPAQTPIYISDGQNNPDFENQQPFSI